MNVRSLFAALAVAGALGVSGCSTLLYGAVPTGQGQVLAVGSKTVFIQSPAAWLCPPAPKGGDCKEINVTEVNR